MYIYTYKNVYILCIYKNVMSNLLNALIISNNL